MRNRLAWKTWTALVAATPLIVPSWNSSAFAADRTSTKPTAITNDADLRTQDVVLHSGNVLVGQVVDHEGNAVAETNVSVFIGR